MARKPKFEFSNLFIAIPEWRFDVQLLEDMLTSRLFSNEDRIFLEETLTQARRYDKTVRRMRGKSVLQRMALLTPELLNVSTVNALRTFGVFDIQEAQTARILARAFTAATRGGVPLNPFAVLARVGAVGSTFLSRDTIDLMKTLDDEEIVRIRNGFLRVARQQGRKGLNKQEQAIIAEFRQSAEELAAKGRAGLTGYRALREAIAAAQRSDSWMQALRMIVPEIATLPVMRAAALLGYLDARQLQVMEQIIAYGPVAWRAGLAAIKADGFEQRLLMGIYGGLTQELLDALFELNVINADTRRLLRPAVSAARDILRERVDRTTAPRKYRVLPGENPINTFARTSRGADRDLLDLLAQASRDASKEATRLAALGKRGAGVRSKQYRIAAAELHAQMRLLWEDAGHLIIRGERETALAAVEAMQELQSGLFKGNGKTIANADAQLRAQGRAGVDSYISRQENLKALSARVYRNRAFFLGELDKKISLSLLQGKSQKELADVVRRYIRPDVPGGVSYAAQRLARTEINNAFHMTSIRYTREQPWVTGYRWHLSNSHGRPDECNTYANDDHDGKGAGIFAKRGVPGKPHPNCLCYVTPVVVDEQTFLRNTQKGYYKQYWSGAASA